MANAQVLERVTDHGQLTDKDDPSCQEDSPCDLGTLSPGSLAHSRSRSLPLRLLSHSSPCLHLCPPTRHQAGRWWFLPAFVFAFLWLYRRTLLAENAKLVSLYGEEFLSYRASTPAFVPRLVSRNKNLASDGFRSWLYWRNKEWEAAVGAAAGFGLLYLRMYLLG